MDRKIYCPVMITEEENWIVATDVNSNVASQGKSISEAMNNLKEALSLYYEDAPLPAENGAKVYLTTMEVCV